MNTALQTFQFDTHQLSLIIDDHGEPWFIASQVCEILEHQNTSMVVSRLDDDEKLTSTLFISGQNREVLLINESGLYSLILTSRKPAAKSFKKWVTSEVLPSIRKTGGYIAPNTEAQKLLDMQNRLLDSQSAQIAYLQEQLSHSQAVAKGMQNIYSEEEAKVQRLLRARGPVKLLERRDIFNKLDEGWEVSQIAKWMYRTPAFVKAVIKAGRYV